MAASSSSSFLFSSSLLLSIVVLTLLPLLSSAAGGFSVDLIHRDSVQSPLHDPNSTPISRLRAAVKRSRSRASYFSIKDINIRSNIVPNAFEYLMTLYIGSPPMKTVAIADTGSDLIWFQCKPCKDCYVQTTPYFDPSSSSTYRSVSCESDSCAAVLESSCTSGGLCQYYYAYGDQSYVVGSLAKETLSFHSPDGGRFVPLPKILFGCTHQSNGTFDSAGAGLVGLGGGQLSLISQLGDAIDNKFSYCLPPLTNNLSCTGRLNFGSKAVVSGPAAVSTRITRGDIDTFFFLTLERITVGQNNASSDSANISVKQSTAENRGNIIIDSGTTLTLIDDNTVRSLENKLLKMVKLQRVRDPQGLFNLCFDISGSDEDGSLPDIIFHFSGEADVVLKPSNTFVTTDEETMCLAIVSNVDFGGSDISIFGNVSQQNFKIGYDLGAMELTFAPADCAEA